MVQKMFCLSDETKKCACDDKTNMDMKYACNTYEMGMNTGVCTSSEGKPFDRQLFHFEWPTAGTTDEIWSIHTLAECAPPPLHIHMGTIKRSVPIFGAAFKM